MASVARTRGGNGCRDSPNQSPPMSDEDALLAAIIANPDEDTTRLVYADWLQENGQAERAEFIRLQIANVGRPVVERSREGELLKQHQKRWGKPFRTLFPGGLFTYQRGFVTTVRTEWRFYQQSLAPLLQMTPVEQIVVGKSYFGNGNYTPYSNQPLHVRFCMSLYAPDGKPSHGDIDILRMEPNGIEPYLRIGRWVIGCTQYRSGHWDIPSYPIMEYSNALESGSMCRIAFRPFKRPSEFDKWCPIELPGGFGYWSDCWVVLQDGEIVDFRPANGENFADWIAACFAP